MAREFLSDRTCHISTTKEKKMFMALHEHPDHCGARDMALQVISLWEIWRCCMKSSFSSPSAQPVSAGQRPPKWVDIIKVRSPTRWTIRSTVNNEWTMCYCPQLSVGEADTGKWRDLLTKSMTRVVLNRESWLPVFHGYHQITLILLVPHPKPVEVHGNLSIEFNGF